MSRNSSIFVFAGAFAAMVAIVLGLIYAAYSIVVADVPPYHFRMNGSAWEVESVDGQPVRELAVRLELDEDGETATLDLSCGEVRLGWIWDSDGNGVDFTNSGRAADCPSTDRDTEILARLTSTEEWRVAGGDRSHRHRPVPWESSIGACRIERPARTPWRRCRDYCWAVGTAS